LLRRWAGRTGLYGLDSCSAVGELVLGAGPGEVAGGLGLFTLAWRAFLPAWGSSTRERCPVHYRDFGDPN